MTDEEMLNRVGSAYKTTGFGQWTRPPETRESKRVDAIRNLTGTSFSVARSEFKVCGFPASIEWEDVNVGLPRI